jgi:hypothetical protein
MLMWRSGLIRFIGYYVTGQFQDPVYTFGYLYIEKRTMVKHAKFRGTF